MKQFKLPNLFLNFFILCILVATFFIMPASQNHCYKFKKIKTSKALFAFEDDLFLLNTLRNFKEIEQNSNNNDELGLIDNRENEDESCVDEILVVLVGTYEKMISATVTYFLMYNISNNKNLHESIAVIITEDMLKIIKIIGSQSIKFIMNSKIKWKKKLYYVLGLTLVSIFIKYGIDIFIYQENNNQENNNMSYEKKDDNKSLLLSNKFDHYK